MRIALASCRATALALLLGIVPAAAPLAGAATPLSTCFFQALERLSRPGQDSTVELELFISKPFLEALTTADGTVGPLLQGTQPPEWLFIHRVRNRVAAIAEVPWDSLSINEKWKLIEHVSGRRDPQSFWQDRKIPGLRVRPTVRMTFNEPTRFLGEFLAPGSHEVDISRYIQPYVEYGGTADFKELQGVEIHFRTPQSAGQASRDATRLLKSLGIEPAHQHVHRVAPLKTGLSPEEIPVEAARLVNFHCRMNLGAELLRVVKDRLPIAPVKQGQVVYFDSLKGEGVLGLTKDVLAHLPSGSIPTGKTHKMAFVGFHGSDVYDRPGLWGSEARDIPAPANPAIEQRSAAFLDGTQAKMFQPAYGLDDENRIRRWLAAPETPGNIPEAMEAQWYNRSWDKLVAAATPSVRALLTRAPLAELKKASKKNEAVKFLVHDWSRDPLFFDQPDRAARMRTAQTQALKNFISARTDAGRNEVIAQFAEEIGIFDSVLGSLGVGIRSY